MHNRNIILLYLTRAVTDTGVELSNVTVENSSELLLGQTLNVFLCAAEFVNTDEPPDGAACMWSVNDDTQNLTYTDLNSCDPLQDSYVSAWL